MADSLKEVIAKRLASSQAPKTTAPIQKVEELEEVEDEDDDDDVPETKKISKKPEQVEDSEERKQMEAIFREIELLQNNGRFRAELLHQLNEINKSLSVVSSAIIDLLK